MEDVRPPGADPERVLLYLHGGGYAVESPRCVRALAARIAAGAGARACVPDYRLAPEHPYPAALQDARAAWDALLADGVDPARIAVAGDSAGGGLSVALALSLRDAGEPLPAVLGLVCPWLDLTPGGVASRPPVPREPILTAGLVARFTHAYLADGHDPADPLISPVRAELAGLPPVVVHSGGDDLLAGDAAVFEERARAAGVDLDHRRYDGLWHDFHVSAPLLAGPGRHAPAELGAALGRRLG
jgi:acetyl esterase/lipase